LDRSQTPIPYGTQSIDDADIRAVVETLQSDWLTQGPAVPAFEKKVALKCCAGHGIAVNSATSALHISCKALGLGPGDWLWTSPNTFVASANCALYCGGRVDFVDIDPRTYNMSAEALAEKLVLAELSGRLPKIVVPVHFAGQPCDMTAIKTLADRYGFKIIEDASHAVGALHAGRPVGDGLFSDITVFSFHPVKIVTTGEGGMALANNEALAERLRLLRSHGITREPALMDQEAEGGWYYQQVDLGYNYRMTDLQAALGISQMDRLDAFIARRQALAKRYDEALKDLPLKLPWQDPAHRSAWHLYVIQALPEAPLSRRDLFDALRSRGILVNVHYIPVHTQPWYRSMGFSEGDFPVAEAYYSRAITLPLHPSLSEPDQDRVIDALKDLLS
jgi:UDP-4-amino-4,6-dideoxy-N-acetyl-beta-L-altrosamine transaminase